MRVEPRFVASRTSVREARFYSSRPGAKGFHHGRTCDPFGRPGRISQRRSSAARAPGPFTAGGDVFSARLRLGEKLPDRKLLGEKGQTFMEFSEMVRTLYGVDQLQRCTDEEINAVREARHASRCCGKVLAHRWPPERTELCARLLVLSGEFSRIGFVAKRGLFYSAHGKSGGCRAGIRQEDLRLPAPPAYGEMGPDGPRILPAPITSGVTEAALTCEAVREFERSPEDNLPSGAGMGVVRGKAPRRPEKPDGLGKHLLQQPPRKSCGIVKWQPPYRPVTARERCDTWKGF